MPTTNDPDDVVRRFNEKYPVSTAYSADPADPDDMVRRFNEKYPVSTYSATGVPIPEPFRSRPLTSGQFQSFRSARTETARGESQLRAAGKGTEVDEALQEHGGFWGTLETATTPIFDLLNIFPQSIASGAIEFHRSGNAAMAYKQLVSDFLNNLPGDVSLAVFEDFLPTPLHATWADFLKEAAPDSFKNDWAAAGVGLLLDILTDPLTYTGVGLVSKLARGKGLLKTAEMLEKATPLTAIKGTARLPIISDILGGIEKSRPYQGFGKRFIKDFEFKQLAKQKPELADSITNALREQRRMVNEIREGRIDVKDAIDAVYDNITAGERLLFGALLDQPEELRSVIRQVAAGDKGVEANLLDKLSSIIQHRNERGLSDVKAGFLSEAAFRGLTGRYGPGMKPATAAGRTASDELLARLGVKKGPLPDEIVPGVAVGPPRQVGQGTLTYGEEKIYGTLEERILAGLPTEFDAAIQDARRGFESVRYGASRRFVDSVLSDRKIAMTIQDLNRAKQLGDMSDFGDSALQSFVKEFGEDVGIQRFGEAKLMLSQMAEQGYGVYRPLRSGEPTYVLPKPFIDQLNYAQRVMTDPDGLKAVLENFKAIQDVWKAWALFSPGYHMRNAFSNFWNNQLAGVRNPAIYGEALILQGANPRKNPILAKLAAPGRLFKGVDDIEAGGLKGQGIVEAARKLGVLGTGQTEADIARSVERELFDNLDGSNDALSLAAKIAPEGKGKFLRDVLETAPVRPGILERQLGTDVAGDFTVKGFAQAQQQTKLLLLNRQVGGAVENNAKLAHFIAKLREGLSQEDAAMSVKKYLFDYSEGLTDFEKNVMKAVVPFYCVPDDCEILTQEGWKRVDDLRVGENVLSMNHVTNGSSWEPLEDVATFDYNGIMLRLGNKLDDYLFTPDHRWPVQYKSRKQNGETSIVREVVRGYQLHSHHKIPRTSKYTQSESIASPRIAAIVGWLVTDGYVRQRYGNHVEMVIYQSPKKYLNKIIELLGDGGSVGKPHPETGVVPVRVVGKLRHEVSNLLPRKEAIVEFVCNLSPESARACYDAMMEAEGNVHPRAGESFAQVDGPVLDAFQILAQMCGFVAHKGRKHGELSGSHVGRIQTFMGVKSTLTHTWYSGRIWCPKTKYGTWLMRRKGRVIWTGNSWMRFNIPLQIQSILENPGRYSALTGKPIAAIESMSEDWKDIPTPDYFSELHAVRLPRYASVALEAANKPLSAATNTLMGMLGSTQPPIQREGIQPEFINPNLPFQDLNRMNFRDALSSLTPILKLFPELVPERGYSTFTDRPLERYPGEAGTLPFMSKKEEHAISTIIPPLGKALRMIEKSKRGQAAEQISTEILGIKLMGVDVDAVNRGKAYQRLEKVRALRQKYRDAGALP